MPSVRQGRVLTSMVKFIQDIEYYRFGKVQFLRACKHDCCGCDLSLTEDGAAGRDWHESCFTCSVCHQPLTESSFICFTKKRVTDVVKTLRCGYCVGSCCVCGSKASPTEGSVYWNTLYCKTCSLHCSTCGSITGHENHMANTGVCKGCAAALEDQSRPTPTLEPWSGWNKGRSPSLALRDSTTNINTARQERGTQSSSDLGSSADTVKAYVRANGLNARSETGGGSARPWLDHGR